MANSRPKSRTTTQTSTSRVYDLPGFDGGRRAPGEYEAYSPNIVAVGGTSLYLDGNGNYLGELGWSGSGGGQSQYEPEPSYQAAVQSTGQRTIPDVAFVGDPNTGVSVLDSYNDPASALWKTIGGTSVSAPCWAGLIAIINQGRVAAGKTTLNSNNDPTQAVTTYTCRQAIFTITWTARSPASATRPRRPT